MRMKISQSIQSSNRCTGRKFISSAWKSMNIKIIFTGRREIKPIHNVVLSLKASGSWSGSSFFINNVGEIKHARYENLGFNNQKIQILLKVTVLKVIILPRCNRQSQVIPKKRSTSTFLMQWIQEGSEGETDFPGNCKVLGFYGMKQGAPQVLSRGK